MMLKCYISASLIISSFYPACLLLSNKLPLKKYFHISHLYMANIIAGSAVILLIFLRLPVAIKLIAIIWKIIFVFGTKILWKNISPKKQSFLLIPCILGIAVFIKILAEFFSIYSIDIYMYIASGFIICYIIFYITTIMTNPVRL